MSCYIRYVCIHVLYDFRADQPDGIGWTIAKS